MITGVGFLNAVFWKYANVCNFPPYLPQPQGFPQYLTQSHFWFSHQSNQYHTGIPYPWPWGISSQPNWFICRNILYLHLNQLLICRSLQKIEWAFQFGALNQFVCFSLFSRRPLLHFQLINVRVITRVITKACTCLTCVTGMHNSDGIDLLLFTLEIFPAAYSQVFPSCRLIITQFSSFLVKLYVSFKSGKAGYSSHALKINLTTPF